MTDRRLAQTVDKVTYDQAVAAPRILRVQSGRPYRIGSDRIGKRVVVEIGADCAPCVMSATQSSNNPLIASITESRRVDEIDVEAWTKRACERSDVPFGIEDSIALEKLRILSRISD